MPTPPQPLLPNSLFDVVLDIPHPGQSSRSSAAAVDYKIYLPPSQPQSSSNDAASLYGSNNIVNCPSPSTLLAEFGSPSAPSSSSSVDLVTADGVMAGSVSSANSGVAKIQRYAFPDYNDNAHAAYLRQYTAMKSGTGWNAMNLNKYDTYLENVYAPPTTANGDGGGNNAAAANSTMAGGVVLNNNSNHGAGGGARLNNSSHGTTTNATNNLRLPLTHTFLHRLNDGTVVHGHVRRYLPSSSSSLLSNSRRRRDIGRRCPRALVILTRTSGGGSRIYNALLKCMEAITIVSNGVSNVGKEKEEEMDAMKYFLHSAYRKHVNAVLSSSTNTKAQQTTTTASSSVRPTALTIPLVELGPNGNAALFEMFDEVRIILPPSFLNVGDVGGSSSDAALSRNDLLPMLRCLGPRQTLRLLSALMSERRVILTVRDVNDIGRLTAVAYGALAMMGQGMLYPSSSTSSSSGKANTLFVPLLPPGLKQLLLTPNAYLIGVLVENNNNNNTTNNTADGGGINLRAVLNEIVGEVIIFDLDGLIDCEPYFHNSTNPRQSIPDITQVNVDDFDIMSNNTTQPSIGDVLHRDLIECLRNDKKLFWQGAVQEKLGLAAAKTKLAAISGMKKGLKFLKGQVASAAGGGSSRDVNNGGEVNDPDEDEVDVDGTGGISTNQSRLVGKGNYAYEGGFPNEASEEMARIAFTTFFVCLLGDVRSYLTQSTPGAPPVPDRQKFMKHRAANGDAPGSGMAILINNFLRGSMFDTFAEARREEVIRAYPVSENSPLFALVTNYHRVQKIAFSANDVRQSVRQIATRADFPGRYLIDWHIRVRERVSQLTSAQAYAGDFARDVSKLAEDCHESGAILVDTMMVLWTRMQEGRGMQWKKAQLALQVLHYLLLNGPVTAITEAMDGFASIRILKSYTETMRGQNAKLIRDASTEVYILLVDTSVLFARRRECMNARRLAKDPRPSPLVKEIRMIKGIQSFRNVHIALRPAGASVAPAPAPVSVMTNGVSGATASSGGYSNDLLGVFTTAAAPIASVPATTNASQLGSYSTDLLSLSFGAAAPSPQVAATNNDVNGGKTSQVDPFSMYEMSRATPRIEQPTTASSLPSQATPSSGPSLSSSTQSTPSQPPFPLMMNGPIVTNNNVLIQSTPSIIPTTAANMTNIHPGQQQSVPQLQTGMDLFPIQNRPLAAPTMNSSFAMMNHTQLPPSQQMLHQQVGFPPSNPMSITPVQGWINQPPPQQQAWTTGTPPFAPNGYQTNHMVPHHYSGPMNGVPAAGYPIMQGAPQQHHQQQHQGAYQQAPKKPPM